MKDLIPEPKKLAIAGDWHGSPGWARHAIEYAADNGADTLIQVGDFGFWRPQDPDSNEYLIRVSAAVRRAGINFLWLPGNHEYWPGLPHDEGMLPGRGKEPTWMGATDKHGEGKYPQNLLYLPIGYRWEWWGKKFMAVGGAFSIDRFLRKEGVSYWLEETLTPDDVDWCCHQPHGMDVIFSHDCPTGVNIPGIGAESKPRGGKDMWPPDMMFQAGLHRRALKDIWDKHHPQKWYHGHYHVPHETFYGPSIFYGLHMDGTTMKQNISFLQAEDLK